MMLIEVGLWIVAVLILFAILAGMTKGAKPVRDRVALLILGGFIFIVVVAAALTI